MKLTGNVFVIRTLKPFEYLFKDCGEIVHVEIIEFYMQNEKHESQFNGQWCVQDDNRNIACQCQNTFAGMLEFISSGSVLRRPDDDSLPMSSSASTISQQVICKY